MVKTFNDQTELLRTFDRQMGAAALVDQMTGHLAALEDALNFAVLPGTRQPVALALAGASTLAAWQALDTCAVERAWRHYELAKRAAQDADAPMYLAHAMAEQAYVLCEAGRPALGVELVRDARRTVAGRASARLTAWLWAAEAELCAQAGMPADCRRALDAATAVIPAGPEDRDPDMLSIFLNGTHLARWQGNVLAMLGDDEAVERLYAGLGSMDPSFVRAQAGVRYDLAHAHLSRGEYDHASDHLRQARLLANRTGSVRQLRRIDVLSSRLAPGPDRPARPRSTPAATSPRDAQTAPRRAAQRPIAPASPTGCHTVPASRESATAPARPVPSHLDRSEPDMSCAHEPR
jgi:hypothetical protein